MRKIILSMALLASVSAFAQQQDEEPTTGWTRGGNVALLFNQAAFNKEWTGGGTNNIAGNLTINYDFNYKSVTGWNWDNKILFDYGATKNQGEENFRKTNDRLEFNSLLGKQASEQWFYSAFLNFKTQATKGYKYEKDGSRNEYTDFMSPAYLQLGVGMLWKKNDNLKVNIAPATARFIFVSKDNTKNGEFFGVEKGETSRFEFGASLSGYAKVDIIENVSVENILNLYSNYLDKPENIDIDYTLNLVMSINKYLSTNFTFQAIYDDNAVKAFQIREVLGVGVNYKF